MTAVPPPPLARCPEEAEVIEKEHAELFKLSDIKKNLDFGTPKVGSSLSGNLEAISLDFMKVYLRLRPFTEEELKNGEDKKSMKVSDDRYVLTLIPPKESNMFKVTARGVGDTIRHYTFSRVFDHTIQQQEFFNETTLPLVQDFVDGNNALIFTYGVTNAGKTYTIQGTPENEGILPRASDFLFESVGDKLLEKVNFCLKMANNLYITTKGEQQEQQDIKEEILSLADEILNETKRESSQLQVSSTTVESSRTSDADNITIDETIKETSTQCQTVEGDSLNEPSNAMEGPLKYAVFVSFYEIYNEFIYDLLCSLPEDKKQRRQVLKLAEDQNGVPYVKGLREIQVNSKEEVLKILTVGRRNLSVAATKLNKDSSRSHCIFTMTLVQVVDVPEPQKARVSKISFCDLAGSERTNKTREVGDRLKEASKINTSLMKLGMCIDALRYNQLHKAEKQNQRVVPFRDSRLTRLFQSFFLGQGRACMIINANMCASAFDETAHVLKFSALAREVQIISKPKVSVAMKKSRATLFEESAEQMAGPSKKPRMTIAWEEGAASPVEEEEEIEEEEEEAEESEEEDDQDEDNQETKEADVAYWKNREKEYREIIDMLKAAVVNEQNKAKELEIRVRKEVASSFHDRIEEMEKRHENRIESTIEIIEEEQKKRMDIMSSMAALREKEVNKDWEKKFSELTEKHENVEKELKEAQELTQSKVAEIESLQEKLKTSDLEMNKLKEELTKRDEEITSLQQKVRQSSSANENEIIEDLQRENEEGRTIIKCQLDEIGELTDENKRLREQIDLNQKMTEASSDSEEYKGKIHSLQNNNKRLEEKLSEVQEEHNQSKDKISSFKEELASLESEKSSLLEKIEIFEEKNRSLERESNRMKTELDEVVELKSEVSRVNEQYQELKAECDRTKASLAESNCSTEENKNLVNELREKMQESDQISGELKKNLAEEKKLNKGLEAQISELQGSLNSAQSEVTEQQDHFRQREDELQDLKREMDVMKSEYEDKIKELKASSLELEEKNQLRDREKTEEVDSFKRERDDLLKQVNSYKQQLDGAQKDKELLEEKQKECNCLDAVLKEMKGKHDQLLQDNQEKSVSLQNLTEKYETIKTELEDLKGKNVQLTKESNQGTSEVQKLQEECARVSGELSSLKEKNVELTQELQEKSATAKELTEKHSHVNAELGDLRRKNEELSQESKQNSSDVQKLQKKIDDLTEEEKGHLKQIGSLEKQLANVTKEKELLEENNKVLITNSANANTQDKTELENLKATLLEMDKTQNEQQDMIERYESAKQKMAEERKELKDVISDLQKDVKKIKKEKDEITSSRDAAEITRSKLAEELRESKLEVQKWKQTSHDHQDKLERMQTEEKDNKEMSKTIESREKEIEKLKSEVKKAQEEKDAELKEFREKRDRIVEALKLQMGEMKMTNETLKKSLDEQLASNVQLKSQNARYMAENSHFQRQQEEASQKSKLSKRKSVSTSALHIPQPVIKQEPLSPQLQHTQLNAPLSPTPVVSLEKLGDIPHKTSEEENAPPAKESNTRATRASRHGKSSTSSQRSTRRLRKTEQRPSTPYADNQSNEDEESGSGPSPSKIRRTTRVGKKKTLSKSSSIKSESMDAAEGVLDDSELTRVTGHSKKFPEPTMELDVTPQLTKKGTKSRKRTAKNKEEKDQTSEDPEEGMTRTKSTRRKGRGANTNNSNGNQVEEEDTASLASTTSKNLSRVGGMIKNSPVGQAFKKIEAVISPANKSPVKSRKIEDQSRQTRRVRKLHTDDISLPLEATPSPEDVRPGRTMAQKHSVSDTPARMIRRLRNRK